MVKGKIKEFALECVKESLSAEIDVVHTCLSYNDLEQRNTLYSLSEKVAETVAIKAYINYTFPKSMKRWMTNEM